MKTKMEKRKRHSFKFSLLKKKEKKFLSFDCYYSHLKTNKIIFVVAVVLFS